MHRPGSGPGTQPLRGIPGYPGQQPQQNRNNPLGATRLQNGKLVNTPSWGFGMPNGGPVISNSQARATSGGSTSFAQTIGSSQSAAPLDLSEFPSLSGAPQPQYQNTGQAVWTNANQRATQQTPVQRPQQPNEPGAPQPQSHHLQDQVPQTLDDAFFPTSQLNGTMDDYRHGGQGGVGQLSSSAQPQPGSIEEFPPLGRNGPGDIGLDRRVNMMQNAASGGFPGSSSFAQGPQASRTPGELLRQGPVGGSEQDNTNTTRPRNGIDSSIFSGLNDPSMNMKPDNFAAQQLAHNQVQAARQQQYQTGFMGDLSESPGAQSRVKTPLHQMSDIDRFGLKGLLEMIRSDNSDISNLAIGQDLTALGLDLNSSEPLYPTFAGPFAGGPARPMQPDFTLPPCYTVHNTHKLEEKVPSFSDETLFYMFYTMPRDVMQEVAAVELTHRNWRYHKNLRVWLTKDAQFADPQPISNEAERGRYVVFNEKVWQRESRDMIIRWADLDDHITNGQVRIGMP